MRILLIAFLLLVPAQDDPIFEEVTKDAGLDAKSARVAFADLNGDGRPDAIINSTLVFLNEKGTFKASGFEPPKRVSLVQTGDVNNDGHVDAFFGRTTDLSNAKFEDDGLRSEIWLGDGKGGFKRVKDSGVGKIAETIVAATFVDYDRDGNLDLFTGAQYTAYGKSLEAFPDRLYRGKGDGTFEDVTEKAGLLCEKAPGTRKSRRPTYGIGHTDWNNDGWQDLLVMTYGRQWNRLWMNNGDGTFTDVAELTTFDGDKDRTGTYPEIVKRKAEKPFRSNGNTFDCAVADFDGDGDMDCFLAEITHWWAGSSSDLSMLLVNRGKKSQFRFKRDVDRIKRTHDVERWNQGDLHAGWMDVDNDGLLDLLIASSDYPDDQILRLYHQKKDHSFEDWTDKLGFKWLNANQLSLADYDRDGAMDILLGTSNNRLTKEQRKDRTLNVGLFRNTLPKSLGNGFLGLHLKGQAIGARVTLWIGDQRQTREVYGGQGHAGHRDDTACLFGTAKAKKADRIEVRWPDGTTEKFLNVKVGRYYSLKKGGKLE